jgi:N-acetylmuramoyl-L-alanine amidase
VTRTTKRVSATLVVMVATASMMTAAEAKPPPPPADRQPPASLSRIEGREASIVAARPLAGKVVVIDPGHQLGNATHPQASRLVNAGGFMKPCNTSGTATNAGFPEATFSWRVARSLQRQLERQGARVYLTRHTNSTADWGPCIDTRGRKGNRVHANAVVSIHGDGAAASKRGFFVIMPANRPGWTTDIHRSSHRLGLKVRGGLKAVGLRTSNSYGGDGLDVRGDLGTLNWSNRPIVMIEMGNMRNAIDAGHMTSRVFRKNHYARGLAIGVKRFVLHR